MELILILIFILLIIILIKVSGLRNSIDGIERFLEDRESRENKIIEQIALDEMDEMRTSRDVDVESSEHVELMVTKEPEELPLKQKILEYKEPVKIMVAQESKRVQEPIEPEKTIVQKYFEGVNLEELLFGNIILKISIVAFILGIGLFLKYSIDKDWIPVWGRVLIGIGVGISMLIGGIKMIENKHKLFSETLFGGGIAVLYLSVFAGYAFEGFKFIDLNFAYIAMILITILAGVISIRFDSKPTAIFGLIGGFATPFLLSTDSGNYVGLLTYMLVLNLGVLYVSRYKNWPLLTWMAFGITGLTQLATTIRTFDSFMSLAVLYGLFYVIYSIVPFASDIKENKKHLGMPSVVLFWVNFLVAIVSFFLLFKHYDIDLLYYAGVTIMMAGYLLIYAKILTRKNILYKNLYYIVLSQAIALLLVTPVFVFSGTSLTIVWAVESVMLLWVAIKSGEKTYAMFSFFGFALTIMRYLTIDLFGRLPHHIYSNDLYTLTYVKQLSISSLFVIGSLFVGYKLLRSTDLKLDYIPKKKASMLLFMVSFFGAYFVMTFLTSVMFNLYGLNIFIISYILIIALFVYLFINSEYSEVYNKVYYLFMGLLLIGFVDIIRNIDGNNSIVSLMSFIIFMAIAWFIYGVAFKESEAKVSNYSISEIMISMGIGLLFVFLNVEIYYVVKLIAAPATKFAITILWVLFGISLFVYGILKDRKVSKIAGTILIFIAILKAFFFDLANMDSIYRIVLFLILGAILFGLSYFYQSKQDHTEE